MRYRALSPSGDYTFGRGQGNFLVNSPACVAQAVQTALALAQGEWFLDKTAGVPWATQILGYGTGPLYDLAIKDAILAVEGVDSITAYSSQLNAATRALTVTATIATIYGAATVTLVI